MENEIKNLKETSIIKQVLTNEVKFIIAIITVVLGVVAPYYGQKEDIALIQKDINIINTNHEAHIQDLTQKMKEIEEDQTTQNAQPNLVSSGVFSSMATFRLDNQ